MFFSLIPSTVTQKKSNYNDVLDYNLTLDVSENNSKEQNFPYNKNGFLEFKEAIGFKESAGKYGRVNKYGYLGKYQFGKETLKLLGIYNTITFLNTPKLQEQAFYVNAKRNKWILRKDIKRFVGKKIAGVIITSDKCYQNKEFKRGYKENDQLAGIDPYSASKSSAEIISHSYFNSFFLDCNYFSFIIFCNTSTFSL